MASSAKELRRYREQAVGHRVAERREVLGKLTQAHIAEALTAMGVPTHVQDVSAMENGQRISLARLIALQAPLRCTLTYLLGGTDDPKVWKPQGPLEDWLMRVVLQGQSPAFDLIHGDGSAPGGPSPLMVALSP